MAQVCNPIYPEVAAEENHNANLSKLARPVSESRKRAGQRVLLCNSGAWNVETVGSGVQANLGYEGVSPHFLNLSHPPPKK